MNTREGFAARDKGGKLNFFLGEPHRVVNTQGVEYWVGHGRMKLPNEFLPELRWVDEPVKVTIKLQIS